MIVAIPVSESEARDRLSPRSHRGPFGEQRTTRELFEAQGVSFPQRGSIYYRWDVGVLLIGNTRDQIPRIEALLRPYTATVVENEEDILRVAQRR